MLKYTGKRIFIGILSLFVLVTAAFFLTRLMPGSPFQSGNVSGDVLKSMEEEYGLDKPMTEQYRLYLGNLLQGDLGVSYKKPGSDCCGSDPPCLAYDSGPWRSGNPGGCDVRNTAWHLAGIFGQKGRERRNISGGHTWNRYPQLCHSPASDVFLRGEAETPSHCRPDRHGELYTACDLAGSIPTAWLLPG